MIQSKDNGQTTSSLSPTDIKNRGSVIGERLNKAIRSPEEQRRLTIKQRKWIREYIDCGNATEAAMRIYDCKDRDSAAIIGFENIRKLNYEDFLEEAGITDNLLQKKILDGLDATRIISAIKGTSANGGTTDFIDVPDFAVRHKYLEMALRLKKRISDKTLGVEVKDGDKTVRVIVEDFV